MTSTISDGTTTWTPQLVTGYQSTRASRNVLTPLLGTHAVAVTFRGKAGLRAGTMEALFTDLTKALACHTGLSAGLQMTFADTDHPALGMTFVTSGDIGLELDAETGRAWLVAFDFQEVD